MVVSGLLVACTSSLVRPGSSLGRVRVSPTAPKLVCYYQTAPDQMAVADVLPVPDPFVVERWENANLTLFDCEEPTHEIWFGRYPLSGQAIAITPEHAKLAEAERLIARAPDDEQAQPTLEKSLELSGEFESPRALLLGYHALRGLRRDGEAIARLERAVAAREASSPKWKREAAFSRMGTDQYPRRAELLLELGDARRRAGESARALEAYRRALTAWNRIIEGRAFEQVVVDIAKRAITIDRIRRIRRSDDEWNRDAKGRVTREFQRVIENGDWLAATLVMQYLVVSAQHADLAYEALFETAAGVGRNAEYWRLYVAALHRRTKRPVPELLESAIAGQLPPEPEEAEPPASAAAAASGQSGSAVAPGSEAAPPAEAAARLRYVQESWLLYEPHPNPESAVDEAARDRRRWRATLSLLYRGEGEWPRIAAAALTPGQLSEALFCRGLFRLAAGNRAGAAADFSALRTWGAVNYVEYEMAQDLLAELAPAGVPGAQP
ncbi:MAG TPA: hypothetical protein VGK73_17400 [Polyangiaceae bacterium]